MVVVVVTCVGLYPDIRFIQPREAGGSVRGPDQAGRGGMGVRKGRDQRYEMGCCEVSRLPRGELPLPTPLPQVRGPEEAELDHGRGEAVGECGGVSAVVGSTYIYIYISVYDFYLSYFIELTARTLLSWYPIDTGC